MRHDKDFKLELIRNIQNILSTNTYDERDMLYKPLWTEQEQAFLKELIIKLLKEITN